MKKLLPGLLFLAAAFTLYGKGIVEEVNLADERAKTSLAFGLVIGSDLKQTGMEFDYAAFTEGLKLSVEGGEAPYTTEEAVGIVQAAFQAAMDKRGEENKERERLFLAENGGREGVISTESGLQYEIITEGSGEKPSETDTVRVHYEGTLSNGTVFDSSYERDESAEIPLEQVIPGWSEGIQLMSVGGVYRFYIPSVLAYGDQGVGQIIPPHSTLVFKVELLEILSPGEEAAAEAEEALPVEGENPELAGDDTEEAVAE
ncbi:MAG: FKBP-type peptidyl-prolyl cis-trans isomerase [Treponema sp.]|jgi:FKBP-type peptidyl-prolyl cis-trans isomerase FkpA|nr:FKBP-type peptidyl-prolyl cis-trans isomerase [Treponema sp.]